MMTTIHIKVDERLKKDFDDKASKLGRPRDMIRNLMQAFVDDRISVQPTTEQSKFFQLKGDVK